MVIVERETDTVLSECLSESIQTVHDPFDLVESRNTGNGHPIRRD